MLRRVTFALLLLAFGGLTLFLLRRPEVSLAPPAPAEPPKPTRLAGRVVDEGGLAAAGAKVQLFGGAPVWTGVEDGCAVSALACSSLEATRQVFAQADAGTLRFPEPRAVTTAAADGTFFFVDAGADVFVVATLGTSGAAQEPIEGAPFVVKLQSVYEAWVSMRGLAGGEALVVNPFTREAQLVPLDGDGQVREVPMLRECWVGMEADGFAPGVRPSGSQSQVVTMTPGRRLEVRLSTDAGPVDGEVSLECRGRHWRARTDGGEVVFPEVTGDICTTKVVAPGFAGKGGVMMTGERVALTVAMEARARLLVTVRDAKGAAVDGAYVSVWRPGVLEQSIFGSPHARGATRDGSVELAGLELETFVVHASLAGLRKTATVTLPQGTTSLELRFDAPLFTGTVVDAEGLPASAWVSLSPLDGGEPFGHSDAVDGGFSISLASPGPFQLSAYSWELGSADVRVEGTVTEHPLVRLQKWNTLALRVHRPDGGPAEGLVAEARGAARTASAGLDARGEARLANLEAGAWTLSITPPGEPPLERVVIIPDAGVVSLDLVLEAGEVLQGQLLLAGQPAPGVRVSGGQRYLMSNAQGRFRLEGLSRGTLQLELEGQGGAHMTWDASVPDQNLHIELQ